MIQFGSGRVPAAMGTHQINGIYGNLEILVRSWMKEPGLSGEAAPIRISSDFRLTRKGQSIMIRPQE